MSENLMDTDPGGETQQYESIKTVTVGHGKDTGQFGGPQTQEATSASDTQSDETSAERAEQTASNIRYGQGISEQGMGGQTTTSSGQANTEGGYGGTGQLASAGDEDPEKTRKEQGYGGDSDMDTTIGA